MTARIIDINDRQLFEEDLISENGTLKGLPWGIVNYHPDECDDGYWHVLWQKGNELRRARVYQVPRFRFEEVRSDLIDQWVNISVCAAFEAAHKANRFDRLVLGIEEGQSGPYRDAILEELRGYLEKDLFPVILRGYLEKDVFRLLARREWGEWYPRADCKNVPEMYAGMNADKMYAQVHQKAVLPELARRERWLKTTREIAGLPQLFVAT